MTRRIPHCRSRAHAARRLVTWQRRWAWWLCVVTAAAWLVSPAWGDRFHPLDDLPEAALLALLVTPSMRRHVGGTFGWRRPDVNSRWWSLKAWLISPRNRSLIHVHRLRRRTTPRRPVDLAARHRPRAVRAGAGRSPPANRLTRSARPAFHPAAGRATCERRLDRGAWLRFASQHTIASSNATRSLSGQIE
jgi:hypothetical protein